MTRLEANRPESTTFDRIQISLSLPKTMECLPMRKRTGRPRVELLEDRKLLATITVNTTSDLAPPSSAMSLRLAIQVADGLVPYSSLSSAQQALITGSLSG